MVLRELREVLVEVEHNRNGDNQQDGLDVCTDELPDDVPVQNADIAGRGEQQEQIAYLPHERQTSSSILYNMQFCSFYSVTNLFDLKHFITR